VATYRVEVDGKVVETHDVEDGTGLAELPAEFAARPAAGEPDRYLYLNDELIGVQTPLEQEG
jgi:hypothetical protein